MARSRNHHPGIGVITRSIALLLLVMLAACDSSREVQGGASDHGAGGRIKLGLPF